MNNSTQLAHGAGVLPNQPARDVGKNNNGGSKRTVLRLYHFTSRQALESILSEGLTKGDVPLSPTRSDNAVWLTTDPDPMGHGLSDDRPFTSEEREAFQRIGVEVPANARFTNKRAIRIAVDIPVNDVALKRWLSWSRLRLKRKWQKALTDTGGGIDKAKTWYVYLGTIGPKMFAEVESLSSLHSSPAAPDASSVSTAVCPFSSSVTTPANSDVPSIVAVDLWEDVHPENEQTKSWQADLEQAPDLLWYQESQTSDASLQPTAQQA